MGAIDWVLQCVAVECSVLQYTLGLILDVALGVRARRLDRRMPMCFSVVLCVATCCGVVDIKVLSREAYAYVLWCVAACSVMHAYAYVVWCVAMLICCSVLRVRVCV